MLNVIFLLAVWFPLEIRKNTTHVQIFAFAAIYGFSSGAFIGVMMSVVADLGDVEDLGQRFGTYQVIVGFGYAIVSHLLVVYLKSEDTS